jgi:hypothetical protein
MNNVYLSVDFDFFSRENPEWEWGHAESSLFQDIAWLTRAGRYKETSLEKYARPHPTKFWDKLVELGFNFDSCKSLTVADSHMWAVNDLLKLCPGQVEIVNFDAHHDMGYRDWKTLKRWLGALRADCSNWLLLLLYHLEHLTAACVYPKWKGLRELREVGNPSWKHPRIEGRFRYGVYSEQYARKLAGNVVGVFIARSGGWMPPWHDQAFIDFATEIGRTLNLAVSTPFKEQERRDPLTVRPFDLPAALAYDRKVQKMLKGMDDERRIQSPLSALRDTECNATTDRE